MLIILWSTFYKRRQEYSTFKILVAIFIPVFGFVFLIITDVLGNQKVNRSVIDKEVEQIFNSVSSTLITSVDNIVKSDVMSLSDILNYKDKKTKRIRLFSEIKGDISKTSNFLKKALKDTDSEVSHYAAAIISGSKQKLLTNTLESRKKFLKNLQSKKAIISFIECIIENINTGLFSEDDVEKQRTELAEVFDILFRSGDKISEKYYIFRIDNEIILGNKTKAFDICRGFSVAHNQSEKPYLMFLKLFSIVGDKKYFFKIIDYVKNNHIAYSQDFDDIIRFWDKAG